jgi:flagellar protein FliS
MTPDVTDQYRAYMAASRTTPKVRQVVMLYEGTIRFMRQAKQAIEDNQVEERYKLLTKASEVILNLQACLDFESGGEIAQTLYDYYSSIDARILAIHRSKDLKLCDSVIDDLREMCQVWRQIDENGSGQGSLQQAGTHTGGSTSDGSMQFSV